MWKTIKEWAFKPSDAITDFVDSEAGKIDAQKIKYPDSIDNVEFLELANSHYCSKCNIFFKTKAGAAAHKAIKHKHE